MNTKAEHAAELHQRGCNCAQAVACTFCKEFGISEDDMFRIRRFWSGYGRDGDVWCIVWNGNDHRP